MDRHYAAILSALAFSTVMFRGLVKQHGLEASIWSAVIAMLVFAGIGLIAGRIAQSIIINSVKATITAEFRSVKEPSEEEGAVWFAPIAGFGSVASSAIAWLMLPVIDRVGLTGMLLLAALIYLACSICSDLAYDIAGRVSSFVTTALVNPELWLYMT